jgi:hypothetical protein
MKPSWGLNDEPTLTNILYQWNETFNHAWIGKLAPAKIYIYIYIYIYKWMKPLTMFEWKANIHKTSIDKTFNKILNELTSICTTIDETFKWPPINQHPPISTSMDGTFNIHKKTQIFNNLFSIWLYLENLHGNLEIV